MDTFGTSILSIIDRLSSLRSTSIIEKGPHISFIERFSTIRRLKVLVKRDFNVCPL